MKWKFSKILKVSLCRKGTTVDHECWKLVKTRLFLFHLPSLGLEPQELMCPDETVITCPLLYTPHTHSSSSDSTVGIVDQIVVIMKNINTMKNKIIC